MAVYSIRDLEKLTGIKAHTIRIWEQRYQIIEPSRTDTNIRFYTDDHLRHLFNIALLNRNGYKISKLAGMTVEEVSRIVAQTATNNNSHSAQIDALTISMIDLDEAAFEKVFVNFVEERGFEQTMLHLIYPFLDKLNVLWLTNSVSPSHEKFVSHLIRRKMMAAIDKIDATPYKDSRLFLLFTPEAEAQELTLLFVQYLLRTRRQRVIYLGASTSLKDLRDAFEASNPEFVYTILQEPLPRQSIQQYVENTASIASNSTLLLSGMQLFVNHMTPPPNAVILNGLPDTMQFLETIRHREATH